MLAEKLRTVERERAGLVDRFTEHLKRPLTEHLDAYRQHLTDKGDCARHVKLTDWRVRRVCDGCGFTRLGDLDVGAVQTFLADLRGTEKGDLGASTVNAYLRAMRSFGRWLVTSGRMPANPMVSVKTLKAEPDRRRKRRALTVGEIGCLLTATAGGNTHHKMTGRERALVYELAVTTGLRASELKSLRVKSFDLDERTVTVEAGYSKRRRRGVLPIRVDVGEHLRVHLDGRNGEERAFNLPAVSRFARMLRKDAKTAKIDLKGMDFHGLRHSFVTVLAKSGIHPKVAQALARHSTISLTMDTYTHTVMDDLHEAVGSLALDLCKKPASDGTGGHGAARAEPDETDDDGGPEADASASETVGLAQTGTDGRLGSEGKMSGTPQHREF